MPRLLSKNILVGVRSRENGGILHEFDLKELGKEKSNKDLGKYLGESADTGFIEDRPQEYNS